MTRPFGTGCAQPRTRLWIGVALAPALPLWSLVCLLPAAPGSPGRLATAASGPSFGAAVLPVLQRNCAFSGCHTGEDAKAGWRVASADATYRSLVGTPSTEKPSMVRVKPGSLADSVLWLKLTNRHREAGIPGKRMPPGSPLTADQLHTVEGWIRADARP